MREAGTFAILDCGYVPRSADEISANDKSRFDKIIEMISDCALGLHDLSRLDLGPDGKAPRFNMPFELGLFVGAQRFGSGRASRKGLLVVHGDAKRFKQALSDFDGYDSLDHRNSARHLVRIIRDWLNEQEPNVILPGATDMWNRYRRFQRHLPSICKEWRLTRDELSFRDFVVATSGWIKRESGAT